ncbi:MucBP domain-containing protein [Holzapfeliella sp. He02]|uniref:MucBP domain-containing protein n=1 Tax=Holzapfeliella saturejae TaxID=3082953 RepID=A0ABU8SFT3_9LACO
MKKNQSKSTKLVAVLACSVALGMAGLSVENTRNTQVVQANDESALESAQESMQIAQTAIKNAQKKYDSDKSEQNKQNLINAQIASTKAAAKLELAKAQKELDSKNEELIKVQENLRQKQEANDNTQTAKDEYNIALLKYNEAKAAVELASANKSAAEEGVNYINIDLTKPTENEDVIAKSMKKQRDQQDIVRLAEAKHNLSQALVEQKLNSDNAQIKESIKRYQDEIREAEDILSFTITTQYVDNQGNKLKEPTVQKLQKGQMYKTEQADIPGYTFSKVKGEASGIIASSDITVSYVYTKNSYVSYYPTYNPTPTPAKPTIAATKAIKVFEGIGVLEWKFEDGKMKPSTEYLHNNDKTDLTDDIKVVDGVKYVRMANNKNQWIQEQYLHEASEAHEESVSGTLTAGNVPYGIFLRDSEGKMTEQMIQPGTAWRVFGKKTFYGHTYYRLGTDQQWIEDTYVNSIEK